MAQLDVDDLRLLADDIHLVNVGNVQETLADILDASLEVGESQTFGGQHVDRRIDVSVLVVKVWSDDASRQVVLDISDLLADLVPKLLDGRRRCLVDQVNLDE